MDTFKQKLGAFVARYKTPLILALLLMALLLPLLVRNAYYLRVIILSGIFMVLASSLNIVIGFTGMFSLGHAAFYGLGAYTSALLATRLGWPIWVGMPLAGLVAGLFGMLIGVATLRLRAIFLAFTTLGFGEIVRIVAINWTDFTGGPMGIKGIPIPRFFGQTFNQRGYYYLILALVVLTVLACSRLRVSRIGRAWASIREDETAAASMGIYVFRYKILAFTVACFIAGVAGSFYAHFARFISADSFGSVESFSIITMIALGGTGSIVGPVLGAGVLIVFPELFRFLTNYRMVIYGLILVLVIVLKPGGIVGVRGIFEKPKTTQLRRPNKKNQGAAA